MKDTSSSDFSVGDDPQLLASEKGWFAIYKPAGMNVHPVAEHEGLALTTWVSQQESFPPSLMLVNRLDRATSGIVLFADGQEQCAQAHRWFAEEQVSKSYQVLVYGVTHRKGIIRRPLQDQRRKRSLPAVTRYRRVESIGPFSLLVVRPETGRKHQIRRHLQSVGHAVLGDRRYRPKKLRDVPGLPERLWLHAARLALPDGFYVECPLPVVLLAHLNLLRERYSQVPKENNGLPNAEN